MSPDGFVVEGGVPGGLLGWMSVVPFVGVLGLSVRLDCAWARPVAISNTAAVIRAVVWMGCFIESFKLG